MLQKVAVKARTAGTGYSRDRFVSWATKRAAPERILRRDLAAVAVQAGSGGCTILKGRLKGPLHR